ncbi:nuclear transport factor 2 family protein [Mycolicibacterium septicum DSM 44393]|uniref:Nuclear transport factor 2 family protein n=1 Tax=Mycolicibacterium septicum DSM 44393 TaxID=1341646 RepID=A0A7X6MQF6_9MYCO|nr:nuclear transport factor 2 family protein [Mycolicibacterium septicum]NKZ12920.1 nuclear transport factor 2 family protein [Mycolicibacterium septicum DSM 44393]
MASSRSGYSVTVTSPVLDELLHIERAGWDSLCESSGADFYGELMLPDAVMVLANGMVMDRNTVVSALAQSPPWRAYEISGVRLIALDDDNAALVYTGTAYRDGDEPAFVGAMSSVYHRVDGVWKLTLYQQTRKPDQ